MISWIIKTSCLYYLPQPYASADNTDLGFDDSWYHAQPHPIIVYYLWLFHCAVISTWIILAYHGDVIFLNSKSPNFYKDMLSLFDELYKTLYNYNPGQIVLFNNREIIIDGKPFFIQEWLSKGIILISDLSDEQGQLLSYQALKTKYNLKTNFLNYCQVRSTIPDSSLAKRKNNNLEPFSKSIFLQSHSIFDLDSSTKVKSETAKVEDSTGYWTRKLIMVHILDLSNGINLCQYVQNNGKKSYIDYPEEISWGNFTSNFSIAESL